MRQPIESSTREEPRASPPGERRPLPSRSVRIVRTVGSGARPVLSAAWPVFRSLVDRQPLNTARPRVSQETLAEMVGTTRSRVDFFINKFRRLGVGRARTAQAKRLQP